jgi:hypothetical protein
VEGSLFTRDLDDGRTIVVYPLTFGRARIVIGKTGDEGYEDSW